jgi:hypothetical protein
MILLRPCLSSPSELIPHPLGEVRSCFRLLPYEPVRVRREVPEPDVTAGSQSDRNAAISLMNFCHAGSPGSGT